MLKIFQENQAAELEGFYKLSPPKTGCNMRALNANVTHMPMGQK